jgi:signal transduction histidine kinase
MQDKTLDLENNGAGEDWLRENARLRGDLLTVARRLSHDLRTPLGGIISSGEAMREILAETDPASLPMVTSALDSAEELSQIIKRASFVLKATAQPEEPQWVPMGDTVAIALERLQRRILAKQVIVTQTGSWPEVEGVSSWLETIWWNLLANALKHAEATPLRIDLGWSREDAQFKFWVSDNGPGVREPRQKTLFYPFERLHETEAGPGLGLPIVRRLVELQGGVCGYEKGPLDGACFFFVLT